MAKAQALSNNQRSMGYALLTFSHSDELEQLLLMTRG